MKILKIWQDDYPWDVRVEKICKTLLDDGHEVHLICSNKVTQKSMEILEGIHIHRFRAHGNDHLNKFLSIPAFFNPFWLYNIYKVSKQEGTDIILVRDLPLAMSAIFVGRLRKVPVIFDMAENFPSMWEEHVDKRGIKSLNHILKNPTVATLMENYVTKKAAHIIVVVKESKDRLIKQGVPEDRISIVSNTPDLTKFDEQAGEEDHFPPGKFKIFYVGYVNGGRGLDIAIKAMPILIKEMNNVCLIIAGGGEYLEELKMMANNLEVNQYVIFLGWVDAKLIPSYIRSSDVCIVPHDATDFVNSTVPNKIFDYMACKKPVVVSNAAPLKRIVNETRCGVVFRSRDVEDFAEKVIQLKDPSVREQKGRNGLMAIKCTYNWEQDSKILREIFETNIASQQSKF